MLRKLHQLLCRHKWRVTRFQALVPGVSCECIKCGKIEQRYYNTRLRPNPDRTGGRIDGR